MDTQELKNLNFRLYKTLLGVQTKEQVVEHHEQLFTQLESLISFFENASELDRHKFNKRKQIIEGSTELTQDEEVLQYLSLGHTLTQKDAIEIFGAYRLSAIIHRLRELGYNIENLMTERKTRYAIYKLN